MYNTTVHEGETKRQPMSEIVEAAIAAFRQGNPVCLFDSDKREGETDLLFPAAFAQPATMRQLRQDCGGLPLFGHWTRCWPSLRVAIFAGFAHTRCSDHRISHLG